MKELTFEQYINSLALDQRHIERLFPRDAAQRIIDDIRNDSVKLRTGLEAFLQVKEVALEGASGFADYWSGVHLCNLIYGTQEINALALEQSDTLDLTVLYPLGIGLLCDPEDSLQVLPRAMVMDHLTKKMVEEQGSVLGFFLYHLGESPVCGPTLINEVTSKPSMLGRLRGLLS